MSRPAAYGTVAAAVLLAAVFIQAAHARETAHTIPGTVFVGDRAVLIVPLRGFSGQGDFELEAARLPSSPDVDIHRVALELRPGGGRLVVEFSAFATGVLELPGFELAGESFGGLSVEISSVLAPFEQPVLSPPAMPLAVPGTALLVYGTIAALVSALLLASLASLRGRALIRNALSAWRRRRMFAAMLSVERRLRKALAKGAEPREIMDELSAEFRAFLAGLSGENCRAMTSAEIGGLDARRLLRPGDPRLQASGCGLSESRFLGSFFSRCDGSRFSGRAVDTDETLAMIDELRGFVAGLGRAAPPRTGPDRIEGAAA